jgi:hypothetical protein
VQVTERHVRTDDVPNVKRDVSVEDMPSVSLFCVSVSHPIHSLLGKSTFANGLKLHAGNKSMLRYSRPLELTLASTGSVGVTHAEMTKVSN